jgi:hypothetical protein
MATISREGIVLAIVIADISRISIVQAMEATGIWLSAQKNLLPSANQEMRKSLNFKTV